MPIPNELVEAIKQAVADHKQPESVSNRLIAWLEELSSKGNLDNAAEVAKSLETVRSALVIKGQVDTL